MRTFLEIIVLSLALGILPLCAGQSINAPPNLAALPVKEPNGLTRYAEPLILKPDPALGEAQIFNPAVLVTGNQLTMLYCSRGKDGGELRLAFSDDGRKFTRSTDHLVVEKGGAEDPYVALIDGVYYMTYVTGGGAEQHLATSPDLVHWDEKGIVLFPGAHAWDKSRVKAASIIPEKIGGKYYMYFIGEAQPWHPSLGLAVSDDLVHWTEPLDHPIMMARPGHFDTWGVEPGATPLILPEGILLFYNGWNAEKVHCTGWALFDKNDPSKLLRRCEKSVIQPDFPYEKVNNDRFTFTESVIFYQGLWRFYYGASDRTISVAEIPDIETLLKATP